MARILMVTWDGGGNVPPALELGRRASARGHSVRVLGPPSIGSRVEAAGCQFRPFSRVPALDCSRGRALEDQMEFLLTRILGGSGPGLDLLDEAERDPPDALVVDCMLLGALAAAERTNVPTAALVHLLYGMAVGDWSKNFSDLIGPVNEVRSIFGLGAIAQDRPIWASAWAPCDRVLVCTPREFDVPVSPLPENVRYVGPLGDAPRLSEPVGDPLALIGFSTTYQHQEAALQRTLDALSDMPVRVLVTLGPGIRPDDIRLPPNAVAEAWIPHDEAVPRCSIVITHAGHGTIMTALAAGVPLLCMPMGRDQHENAARVEACGAGRSIAEESDAAAIRAAIADILAEPSYRLAARRMASVIRGYDGGRRAVAELEALAQK
jgi:UDP:flavonoid glycosyltransferase YjiC (YdhE family)